MALKNKPIDAKAPIDARVAAGITARLEDGRLRCAAAWDIAGQLGLDPIAVGRTADQLRVPLSACQLGFFGHGCRGEDKGGRETGVPGAFAEALLAARSERGEMSCARLWEEAERFGVPRLEAGALADRLLIKIRDCDLGAF